MKTDYLASGREKVVYIIICTVLVKRIAVDTIIAKRELK